MGREAGFLKVKAQKNISMDTEKRLELAKKNAAELVTEEEVRGILEEKRVPVTYCGYEPSGEFHLGHMVTGNKLIDLEKAGFNVKVLLADWHAWLNRKGDWEFIHGTAKEWEKQFKAFGLKDAEYVLGSSFQKKAEYMEDLLKLSHSSTINRALRSMQEIAREIETARVSQILYPLMQITDIKHLKVDLTEAGMEQRKIHMLGREIMQEIGCKKPSFVHTPLLSSLSGGKGKMSSSLPDSVVSSKDSEKEVEKKVGKAFCPEKRAEGNPVLEIAKLVVFPKTKEIEVKRDKKFGGNISFLSFPELENEFRKGSLHPMDLKKAIAGHLNEILQPLRKARR